MAALRLFGTALCFVTLGTDFSLYYRSLLLLQLYAPDYFDVVVTRDQLAYAWKWTALGYAGLAGLHFLLTTRPG